MGKVNVIASAKTLVLIDVVLYPLFYLWVSVSPDSCEQLMNLFVAGLHLKVTESDSNIQNILLGKTCLSADRTLLTNHYFDYATS